MYSLLTYEYAREIGRAVTAPDRIRAIKRMNEYRELRRAYLSGDVTDTELCRWVHELVGEREGCIFGGSVAAETIVLVLAERLTEKGADLLAKQARMDLCGLGMLSAIARHCLYSVVPLGQAEIEANLDE